MSGDNSLAALLGPSARPMVAFGGKDAWKHRVIKGVHCSFQWLDLRPHGFEDTPDHACVPCMCLFRPHVLGCEPFIVPQPHAYLYGDNKGNPTAHLFSSAFDAADGLGFDMRDKHALRTVVDIIIEGLPDLICMPSEPPEHSDVLVKAALMGIEATAKINGKVIREDVL